MEERKGPHRATARAPANIAFTKYWGWRDQGLTLPYHDTISMNLSACLTTTTVAPATGKADEITLLGPGHREIPVTPKIRARVVGHLDFLRREAGISPALRVVSVNTMPAAAGLASSASGFAALTLAASQALGLRPDPKRLSVWARRSGSGSAARSIPDGFVRWYAGSGEDGEDSFAESIFPARHWDLADVVAVVEAQPKEISSREGHLLASTSPEFAARLAVMGERNRRVLASLRERHLSELGEVLEEEVASFHRVAETSDARAYYRTSATAVVTEHVRGLRREGVAAYFTLDAGPNVHVLCEAKSVPAVLEALESAGVVDYTIVNYPCDGARLVDEHVF